MGGNIRPYAFVENVVTHGEYRKKGYAADCLNFAKKIAEENNYYKMMLLTGSKSYTKNPENESELRTIKYSDRL